MSPLSTSRSHVAPDPAVSVVLIGSGGHARVLAATLRLLNVGIAAIAQPAVARRSDDAAPTAPVIADEDVGHYHGRLLVNGVGGAGVMLARRQVHARFAATGRAFMTVVHPAAFVADCVALGAGAQIMAGAIVQAGASIGANAIINTRAVVEHDCRIGDHAHIATGAVLAGNVHVGEASFIGASAVVRQGIRIGVEALVAAGAVVVRDVPDRGRVAGVPARAMRSGDP